MDLVKVTSLDTTGQLVFRDIKEFNRIQSEVFPVAYHSNENMLVCAPTGAGKTNIALLAIVHQIKCHMEANLIRKNDFKVKKYSYFADVSFLVAIFYLSITFLDNLCVSYESIGNRNGYEFLKKTSTDWNICKGMYWRYAIDKKRNR